MLVVVVDAQMPEALLEIVERHLTEMGFIRCDHDCDDCAHHDECEHPDDCGCDHDCEREQ